MPPSTPPLPTRSVPTPLPREIADDHSLDHAPPGLRSRELLPRHAPRRRAGHDAADRPGAADDHGGGGHRRPDRTDHRFGHDHGAAAGLRRAHHDDAGRAHLAARDPAARLLPRTVGFSGAFLIIIMLPLMARYGADVAPRLKEILSIGWVFLLQEIGNVGTVVLGLPIALLLGLRRHAIGSALGLGREGELAYISEKYTLNS